jgi:threonine aldolase
MKKARRYRKMLGGGMRQTGWLAACGLAALSEQNIARLAEDHAHARLLAEGLARLPGFSVDLARTQTNFVIARFENTAMDARDLAARLKSEGVLVMPADARTLRLVTSSRVTADDVRDALGALRRLLSSG